MPIGRRDGRGEAAPLVIDIAAAAEQPPLEDARSWSREQRVFISSVMTELRAERMAVAAAIRDCGAEPVLFEEFHGRDADATDAYTAELATCGIYVGILGSAYGRLLPDRFSATHKEYRYAEDHALRICVYPLDVPDRDGRAQAFLEEVWQFHTAPFVEAADLPRAVTRRLGQLAAEELCPWCKLGDLVFRAASIRETKDQIVVKARIRSRDVIHRFDAMHEDRWGRSEGLFSAVGRSQDVRVKEVESLTTVSNAREFTLVMERREPQRDPMLDVSFGNKSPAEITNIAVRSALFGERDGDSDDFMASVTDLGDPLGPLQSVPVPDEIVRPIVQLLLCEALIGSGRATRLTRFRLGTAVSGRRSIDLGWETRGQYSNEAPRLWRVEGQIELGRTRRTGR